MWKITEKQISELKELMMIPAPSSGEERIVKILYDKLINICDRTEVDTLGNIVGMIRPEATMQIALVAHMDQVALQIISKGPAYRFRKIGGIKPIFLLGQEVSVLTVDGPKSGIIGCDPLQDNETENGFLLRTKDLWIDIQEKANVEIGNFVIYRPNFQLNNTWVTGTALDDRIGIFALLSVLPTLIEQSGIGIQLIFTVQEELSLRGIEALTGRYHPDVAFVLDVDYATDMPEDNEGRETLALGKGIGLNMNADNNPVLHHLIRKIADDKQLPYQLTVGKFMTGGTDAAKLQLQGTACANINFPCRYMHTPREMCDLRDVEVAVNVLTAVICTLNRTPNIRFRPGIDSY